MRNDRSRREFLETLGIGTAGLLLGGYTSSARGFAKNETLNVGVIGTGGRARRRLMPALKEFPGVRITAVCDVYDAHLEAGRFLAGGDGVFATRDHEKLLGRKDVDAVVIATPDHWHVPITIDACAAGKDVYVEKPLTHTIAEGQAVIDAQNRHKRVVQVGMQQRSMPQFKQARQILESGKLGSVHKIHMTWNRNAPGIKHKPKLNIPVEQVDWQRFLGNAPDQPYDPYRLRAWRWFWDFGGGILTDLMVHWLDGVNMLLDLPAPATAASVGHSLLADHWQTPDTVQTLLNYSDRPLQIHFEGTFASSRNRAGVTLMTPEATMYLDRGRLEVTPEPNREIEPVENVLGDGPRGSDFFDSPDGEKLHLNDWLECIRSRKAPIAPAEAGVIAAHGAHLANQSLRENAIARRN